MSVRSSSRVRRSIAYLTSGGDKPSLSAIHAMSLVKSFVWVKFKIAKWYQSAMRWNSSLESCEYSILLYDEEFLDLFDLLDSASSRNCAGRTYVGKSYPIACLPLSQIAAAQDVRITFDLAKPAGIASGQGIGFLHSLSGTELLSQRQEQRKYCGILHRTSSSLPILML